MNSQCERVLIFYDLKTFNLHKNVKYDALWHINLINGFLIVCPKDECGARMQANEKNGNIMPVKKKQQVNIMS